MKPQPNLGSSVGAATKDVLPDKPMVVPNPPVVAGTGEKKG